MATRNVSLLYMVSAGLRNSLNYALNATRPRDGQLINDEYSLKYAGKDRTSTIIRLVIPNLGIAPNLQIASLVSG